MRISGVAVLVIAALCLGQCPLGFTPGQACPEDNPTCALYTDADGDLLCDNPGPQTSSGTEDDTEEEIVEDTLSTGPDTLIVTETPPDTLLETPPDTVPESVTEDESPGSTGEEVPETTEESSEQQTEQAVTEDSEELPESLLQPATIGDRIVVLRNEQGNPYCLNPRSDSVAGYSCRIWDLHETLTDSSRITEGIQIELSAESVYVDTITIEEVSTPRSTCPLGFTPEQACPEESPSCALYTDGNSDLFCDNPGVLPQDTASTLRFDVHGRAYSLVPVASGCPLGLPPEAACPSPENRLCAHYKGWSGCTNPLSGGMSRTLIILVVIAVLLISSTILKRKLCGLGRAQQKKRKIAHITVQLISLIFLGFLVQGCFCPIGLVQYAFLPVGLIFLGVLGIGVLILPMVWSAFFDRIFCGWVCPFGALQDLLGKLHVPRPPRFPHKVHMVMSGFRYLLALLFFGFLVLAGSGYFPSLQPQAFFCNIDPFHTIFSFFLVGSFTIAIATICILIFFPRFFCKYLCFYGAILSFLGRIGLWNRITHKKLPKACEDEETEDLEFPPH